MSADAPGVADDGRVLLRIGPVDATAARVWTAHMLGSLDVVARSSDRLPFRLPPEVTADFRRLLREWNGIATGREVFEWQGQFDLDRLRSLVRYWANLDALTDDQMAGLGVTWSPPHARPFFDALATAVATTLAETGDTDPFADLLADKGRVPGEPLARGTDGTRG